MTKQAQFLSRGSRDSSTFDSTYQTLGNPNSSPTVLVKIQNDSDKDIDISTDGTTDHDWVKAGSFTLYDIRTNTGRLVDFVFKQGTQFYIKGTAGTGLVYLTCIAEVDL